MRVASIDIGTNTVSLLVADVDAGGALSCVVDREVVTRLGAGVDRTRVLADDAVARTLACLDDFARTIASARCDAVAMVGTSALRDAHGAEAFRDGARAIVGVDPRVLSGDEEATFTFAVALALPRYDVARIHGAVVATAQLEAALARLELARTDERRAIPAMVAARADVIVAGGHIAIALLRRLGAASVVVSDRGVRWGLAHDLARNARVTTI